jgi:hypothetical protein
LPAASGNQKEGSRMTDAANRLDFSTLPNLDALRRTILTYTVPFAGVQDDEPRQQGSGVLFRIADAHFVLTAAHVVEPCKNKHGIPMFIGAGPLNSPGISLNGLRVMIDEGDPDLAVIELSPGAAGEIARTHRFLNLAQCEFAPSYHPLQPFLVLGYPLVQTQFDTENRRLSVEPFAYVTSHYPVGTCKIPDDVYRQTLHLLFDYSEGFIDDQGISVPLPAPHGISGCGVWRIGRPDLPPAEWAPDEFKLIAIEHGLLPETRALIGTRLKNSFDLLLSYHPELEPAFRLSVPGSK